MRKALVKRGDKIVEVTIDENTYKTGGSNLIKRKDGSYSQRGLWDNIRANKGSGRKPTKQMLDQAKKITRNKKQTGGEEIYGNYMLPEFEVEENTGMYNPNIVGPSAPRYVPSETGFIPNPNYTTGSGSTESIPLELFAAPIARGLSSAIGMIPQSWVTTTGTAGSLLGLESCSTGKCRGLKAHPNYKKSWGKSKKRRRQEGGEENQFEELVDKIEDALEQGANPQELFQQLIKMGVDENSAKEIIQTAIQEIQGEGEENEDEESNRMMAYGGSADPCPPNYYWDEDEGKCVPMSQSLPSRDDLYNNPEMQKDLDRLNYKRNIQQYKIDYNNNKNKFYQDNYKGPKIKDEKGRVQPDYNSPEYKDFKILYDEYLKTLPNPDRSSFKLPADYQKKNFYPKEGEWDEDSKKEFNRFFNPEPTQQEKEEGILKEYLKSKPQVNPDFYYNDIPADDPVQQYKMNQDQLRDYRYEEEWCPCYKMREELIAGRPVMKKICVPCEQAKMGGNLDKFMKKGGDKKQLSSSVKTASNSDVLNQTRNIITNTGSNNDITDTENFSRITNNYPDKASDTSYMYMYNSATDPSKGINFFYNTSIDPDTGNPIINFNNGQSITPEQEAYYKQLIAAGLNIPNDFKEGGSYRVYKTSERKGKTHKVVGPGGVTKYFGDPKLGERSKSKYGKKGFYARHKKNLDNNPFFRAYARATWAEGGEPSYMNEPEYKTNSFISKVKEMGQIENDKNLYNSIMEQSQQMLMQMGGIQKIGYNGISNSNLASMQAMEGEYNQNSNIFKAFTDINKAVIDSKGDKIKAAMEMAGAAGAAYLGLPPGVGKEVGKIAGEATVGAISNTNKTTQNVIKNLESPTAYSDFKQGVNNQSTAQNPTQQQQSTSSGSNSLSGLSGILGGAGSGSGGGSGDALGSMLKGVMSNPEMLTSLIGARRGGTLRKFVTAGEFDFTTLNQNNLITGLNGPSETGLENEINLPTNNWWDIGNTTSFSSNPQNITAPNQPKQYQMDPLQSPGREIVSAPTNPIYQNQEKEKPETKNNKVIGPAIAGFVQSFGDKKRAKEQDTNIQQATSNSDSVFGYNRIEDRGDFNLNQGLFRPDEKLVYAGINPTTRLSGKYGGYMPYPTATPESVVYGKPNKKMSNTLGPVDRDKANLEAEGGETVMTPAGDDGIPKFFKIGGQRHSQGGTPLYLPENSFIFSDTRSMLLGKNMLEEFGITGKKKKTPAEVAKILGKGYEKYVKIIQDPNSDSIERRTAEMMIQTQINNLGKLALAQESKKGFPQGIPMISVPYMESIGVSAEQLLPQQPQIPQGMPQGNMMPPEMMQQMMQMQQMPMAKYGLQKYQVAGQNNVFGDPNAPFPTSSPSTPESPNIAQRLIGSLFNLAMGFPENQSPIPTKVFPNTVIKGFPEGYDELKEFISTANELSGNDFQIITDEYQGRLDAINVLRDALINRRITKEQYDTERDRIVNELDNYINYMEEYDIPGSWSGNPWGVQNKLEDLADILSEEKQKLLDTEKYIGTRSESESRVNELISERKKIEELAKDPKITALDKFKYNELIKNINKAIEWENYEIDKYNRNFLSPITQNYTSKDGFVYYGPNSVSSNIVPYVHDSDLSLDIPEKYTYYDYMKSIPTGTTVKPSYESQQGTLNNILSTATQDTTTVPVQDTVPTQTAPVTTPSQPSKQTKSNSSNSNNNKSFISKIKKVEDKDLDLFK
jgi:hypothetical protein